MIAILGCKASKQDYECPADEMYSKSWVYRAQRDFIKQTYNEYFILSTKYGVIKPTRVIQPYNTTVYTNQTISKKGSYNNSVFKQAANKINKMVGEIHLHSSIIYYKELKPYLNKEIKHIKQQRIFGQIQSAYNEGLEMYNGDNINDCLEHIQKRRLSKYNEQPKWFTHPEYGDFYGKASQLKRAFPNHVDEGTAYKLSTFRLEQHKQWRIK